MRFEQSRIVFDFVRAAFASSRTLCTGLSRRLRDGVALCSKRSPPSPLHESAARTHFSRDSDTAFYSVKNPIADGPNSFPAFS